MEIFPLKNTILNLEIRIFRKPKIDKLKRELSDFFENNLIEGNKIEDFEIREDSGSYDIIPTKPHLEETLYKGDYEKQLERMGRKYGIKNFGFIYYCYGK